MICIEGCILASEFYERLNYPIRIQYQGAAQAAGLMLMNSMACRVFRLLRQRGYVDETTLPSTVASDVVVYTVSPVGDMTQIDV